MWPLLPLFPDVSFTLKHFCLEISKAFWTICTDYALITGLICQNPSPVASVINPAGSTDKDTCQRSPRPSVSPLRLEGVWATLVLTLWVWAKQIISLVITTLAKVMPHRKPASALIWFLFYPGPFHHLMVTDQFMRRALSGQQRNKALLSFTNGETPSVQYTMHPAMNILLPTGRGSHPNEK